MFFKLGYKFNHFWQQETFKKVELHKHGRVILGWLARKSKPERHFLEVGQGGLV
jgi:hypothetical protein